MKASRLTWRADWIGFGVAAVLIAAFLVRDVLLLRLIIGLQPLGIDFLPLWTGARVDPARVYDFAYVTAQQAWLFVGAHRPFVYPPSALVFLKPFGALPFWAAYPLFMVTTGALFIWAARRIGADWRFMLLPQHMLLVVCAGQVTFLIGGLVMAALSLKERPILAGVLFGIAGAIKPQMLALLPLALVVEGNWRAFWATGVTAILLGLISLPLGASWMEWVEALPRFRDIIAADRGLAATTLTPFARWGAGSLLISVPAALAAVWLAFRSESPAQRTLALLGGALIVSPYAMNYEIALLVPAVLGLRKPLLWSTPFWLALLIFPSGPVSLLAAMALLFISLAARPAKAPEAAPA